MNKNGPVIIIEDDADDQEILTEIFQKLNYQNKIMFFFDGQEALHYINKTDILPFLILSDINMPKLNGFELREKLKTDAELQIKCIPYLFFSTALNQKSVIDAYSMSVQGFFVKQSSMSELEKTISVIMEYTLPQMQGAGSVTRGPLAFLAHVNGEKLFSADGHAPILFDIDFPHARFRFSRPTPENPYYDVLSECSLIFPSAEFCAGAIQLRLYTLIASIDVIHAVDRSLAASYQCSQHQRGAGPEVGGDHSRTASPRPRNYRLPPFDANVGAHPRQFLDVHESVLERWFP